MDDLVQDSLSTHTGLEERLAHAKAARASSDPNRPREEYPAIDSYLAAASRHLGAMLSVVLPAARSHLDDGPARCHEYVEAVRRHEEALNAVKAKLYRSAYATRDSWTRIWNEVDASFAALWDVESALISDLSAAHRPKDPDWAPALHRAEVRSPTRPHPNIPHTGVPGRAARFVARRVDAFWDAAEGRMVPAPLHAHDHQRDGLFTQYLMADPHLAQPGAPGAEESRPVGPGEAAPDASGDPVSTNPVSRTGFPRSPSPLGNPAGTTDVPEDPLGNPVGTPLAHPVDAPSAEPADGPVGAPPDDDADADDQRSGG